MDEKSVVIYDSNAEYAKRLVDYLEYNNVYKVKLFTTTGSLENYVRDRTQDLYILEDSNITRQMVTMYNLNSLLITGDRMAREIGGFKFMYKYLPAPDFVTRINMMMEMDFKPQEEEFRVCALVSPVHRLDLDNILLKLSGRCEHKVCVVDFRGQQVWISLHKEELGDEHVNVAGLADVLYAAHEDNDVLTELIKGNMISINSFEVLSGLVDENDTGAIEPRDLDCLINCIAASGRFDRTIIICDTNLLLQLRDSIAGKYIVAVIRGRDNEQYICKKLKDKGVIFNDTIVTSKVESILDTVWSDEVEEEYRQEIDEVTDVFINEGIV